VPPSGLQVGGLDRGVKLPGVLPLLARTEARILSAAKGHVVVGARGGEIDHDTAAHRTLFKIHGGSEGLGNDASGEAKLGVVQDGQRFLVALGFDHTGDGREQLLSINRHVIVGINKQGRGHIKARLVEFEPFTAEQQLGAFFAAFLYPV